LLLDTDENKPADFLTKQINLAWNIGILHFIFGFLEAAAHYFQSESDEMIFGVTGYVIIKLSVLVTFVLFQRGFILIESLFKNYFCNRDFWDKHAAGLRCGHCFFRLSRTKVCLGRRICKLWSNRYCLWFFIGPARTCYWHYCKKAGIFEAIAGCFFITIVLFFIGHILLIATEIVEIIMVFKVIEIIKLKQTEYN